MILYARGQLLLLLVCVAYIVNIIVNLVHILINLLLLLLIRLRWLIMDDGNLQAIVTLLAWNK